MGKTGLGINIAEHIARFHDRVVYVFSLEMMEDELVKRMVSSIGRVAGDKLKGRLLLTDAELRRVASARDEIRKLPIVIDDGSAKTVSKIRSQARLARRKHGADVIIVDHIGLIHPDSDNRGESRQQHIGKCSRMLKNLARAPWPYTADDARWFASQPQDPRCPHFFVTLPTSSAPAEMIGCVGLAEVDGEVELGYWFAREHWGKGYATEGAIATIDWAFDQFGWDEVIHTINPANVNSQAVARRLGSTILRSVTMPAPFEGQVQDAWGQSREAWRARRR